MDRINSRRCTLSLDKRPWAINDCFRASSKIPCGPVLTEVWQYMYMVTSNLRQVMVWLIHLANQRLGQNWSWHSHRIISLEPISQFLVTRRQLPGGNCQHRSTFTYNSSLSSWRWHTSDNSDNDHPEHLQVNVHMHSTLSNYIHMLVDPNNTSLCKKKIHVGSGCQFYQ